MNFLDKLRNYTIKTFKEHLGITLSHYIQTVLLKATVCMVGYYIFGTLLFILLVPYILCGFHVYTLKLALLILFGLFLGFHIAFNHYLTIFISYMESHGITIEQLHELSLKLKEK